MYIYFALYKRYSFRSRYLGIFRYLKSFRSDLIDIDYQSILCNATFLYDGWVLSFLFPYLEGGAVYSEPYTIKSELNYLGINVINKNKQVWIKLGINVINENKQDQGRNGRQGSQGLVLGWILRNRKLLCTGSVLVKWPPLWRPCLTKIYRGGPEDCTQVFTNELAQNLVLSANWYSDSCLISQTEFGQENLKWYQPKKVPTTSARKNTTSLFTNLSNKNLIIIRPVFRIIIAFLVQR